MGCPRDNRPHGVMPNVVNIACRPSPKNLVARNTSVVETVIKVFTIQTGKIWTCRVSFSRATQTISNNQSNRQMENMSTSAGVPKQSSQKLDNLSLFRH